MPTHISFSIRLSQSERTLLQAAVDRHNATNPPITLSAAIKWAAFTWARQTIEQETK